MEIIYYDLNSRLLNEIEPLVAAIGFFDGLHRGHKQLVDETIAQAKFKNMKSALITFAPAPTSILFDEQESLLSTIEERSKVAKIYGIEVFIVLRFSKELSGMEPNLFYKDVIKKLNVKHLVCGEDFKFGYRGSGNVETLKKIDELGLSVIKDYKYKSERISSTRIKTDLKNGQMDLVNEMLGYDYELNGFVMHGRKKGRTIGFPTLNLLIEKSKFIPKDGVYIGVSVIKGKNYVSTINIGHNPTINTVEQKSIESFVHDYQQDTYGQRVTFKILEYIREEKKFSDVEELIEQMNKDINITKVYFNEEKRRAYKIETI